MSSVRDRIEAQQYLERQKADAADAKTAAAAQAQQDAQPDFIPRTANYGGLTVAAPTTLTRRQRQELADELANPEQLTAPAQRSTVGVGSNNEGNVAFVRTRDRLEQAQTPTVEEPPRAEAPGTGWYGELREKWKREDEADEAAKLKAKQEKEAALAAQQKVEAEEALWLLSVNGVLDTLQATDAERARVLALPTVKVGVDPNRVGGILLTLRSCVGAAPEWVTWAGGKKK